MLKCWWETQDAGPCSGEVIAAYETSLTQTFCPVCRRHGKGFKLTYIGTSEFNRMLARHTAKTLRGGQS